MAAVSKVRHLGWPGPQQRRGLVALFSQRGRCIAAASTAAAAGAAAVVATTAAGLCSAQGLSLTDLDKGYPQRTTNPLAVIRKRPAQPRVPGESQYTTSEVADHNRSDDMWVTYKDGVYDVTEFAAVSSSQNSALHHPVLFRFTCATF